MEKVQNQIKPDGALYLSAKSEMAPKTSFVDIKNELQFLMFLNASS